MEICCQKHRSVRSKTPCEANRSNRSDLDDINELGETESTNREKPRIESPVSSLSLVFDSGASAEKYILGLLPLKCRPCFEQISIKSPAIQSQPSPKQDSLARSYLLSPFSKCALSLLCSHSRPVWPWRLPQPTPLMCWWSAYVAIKQSCYEWHDWQWEFL